MINKSEMVLESTKLVNTYGTVASAIYASSGSKVTTVDVDMSGLEGPDDCNFENSGVIVGELADSFTITNSIFSDNECSYIYSDRSDVVVTNSTFTGGKLNPYINMKGANLRLTNATLEEAVQDLKTFGRGVKCEDCLTVEIETSTFRGLRAYQGGAVYLKDSLSGLFTDNTFDQNLAKQGGAVFVQNSELVVQNNTFFANQARGSLNETVTRNMLSYIKDIGAGGAVFFTCTDLTDPLGRFVTTKREEDEDCDPNKDPKCNRLDDEVSTDGVILDIIDNTICDLSISNSTFKANWAEEAGSTIFYTNKNVTAQNNTQECTENCDISPPDKLKFKIETTYDTDEIVTTPEFL